MTTTANGKKRPVRVFLDEQHHSRFLIQAGTHLLTPSALGELIMHDGLDRLERGDLTALGLADATQRPGSGA
ncbi:hypothetical protein [Litchfieldella rifensis]|uniref:Uncharacterized protein n=1 Tax=Litchfieldella rifensis TaxID=762643 RepID=A0ABV7LLG4_9GAMM